MAAHDWITRLMTCGELSRNKLYNVLIVCDKNVTCDFLNVGKKNVAKISNTLKRTVPQAFYLRNLFDETNNGSTHVLHWIKAECQHIFHEFFQQFGIGMHQQLLDFFDRFTPFSCAPNTLTAFIQPIDDLRITRKIFNGWISQIKERVFVYIFTHLGSSTGYTFIGEQRGMLFSWPTAKKQIIHHSYE